jgi:hypothetical protein
MGHGMASGSQEPSALRSRSSRESLTGASGCASTISASSLASM